MQLGLLALTHCILAIIAFSQITTCSAYSIVPSILAASILGGSFSSGFVALAQEVHNNDEDDQGSEIKSKDERDLTLIERLFGSTLYVLGYDTDKEGKQQKAVFEAATDELVKDAKVIGVYFSASWCAPCRQFTPILAKFYEEMKQQKKNLEIIWISRDQTSDEFLQYFAKMPWLAVPMQNIQEVYQRLAPSYQVKGIPHLVFIDAKSGDIVTLDGRTKVLQDPYGLQFPWRSRSLTSLLPSSLKQIVYAHVKSFREKVKDIIFTFLQGLLPSSVLRQFVKR